MSAHIITTSVTPDGHTLVDCTCGEGIETTPAGMGGIPGPVLIGRWIAHHKRGRRAKR